MFAVHFYCLPSLVLKLLGYIWGTRKKMKNLTNDSIIRMCVVQTPIT